MPDTRRFAPWRICMLLVCAMPVLPEYCCIPLSVAALFFAYRDCKEHGLLLRLGSMAPWLLAYIAFLALSALYSANPMQTLATSGMWAVAFCTYVAVYSVLRDRERLQHMLHGIAYVAGALGLLGTLQYICHHVLCWNVSLQFWAFLDNWVYQWFPMDMINMFGARAAGTFNNSNVYACYLVLALPIVSGLAISARDDKRRVWLRLCVLFTATGIAFSFSRGAYLALIGIMALFVLFTVRRNSAVWLSLLAAAMLLPDAVMRRFTSFDITDIAITERFKIWATALHNIACRPLWGFGAGVQNTWDMLLAGGINAPHTHNLLFQVLCEGGVLALTLLAFPIGMAWRSARQLKKLHQGTYCIGLAQQGWIVSLLIFGLTDFPLLAPKNVTFFVLLLALANCADTVLLQQSPLSLHRRAAQPLTKP